MSNTTGTTSVKKSSTTSKTVKKQNDGQAVEQIESAIAELANAEADAKNANATSSLARAKRSSAAVGVIKAADAAGSDEKSLRQSLLGAGVPKGTVSKIITVLRAVRETKIEAIADGASLSGLYALATKGDKVEAVQAAPAGPQIQEVIKEVVKEKEYATVEDMADDLIARFVLSADDPFKVSGRVLNMLTEKIDKAVAPFSHSED